MQIVDIGRSAATPSSAAIRMRSVSELRPDPNNPRTHTRKQIKQIAASIKSFGFNVPILIDSKKRIIAGHARLEAAIYLGMTFVPTIMLDHLSESKANAFLIAENKLTENGGWDERRLAKQFQSLLEAELDFSINDTGFEVAEVESIIENAENPAQEECLEVPAPKTSNRVTQLGDVWLLDKHRLICGNALDAGCYKTLFNGKNAAMALADAPYNVPIHKYATGFGKVQHREFEMAAGEMSSEEFQRFLTTFLSNSANHLQDGAIAFVFMDWHHAYEVLCAGRSTFSELKNICVWTKDNGGQGSLYRSQHELIFVFKKGRAAHCNNIQLGQFGRYRTNVWKYPGANSFARSGEESHLFQAHPTVKPVSLVADAILDCSRRQDIILDPFLGSGTTMIAAERTGRTCFGIELDRTYTDFAVQRWQKYTGLTAFLESSGQSFAEVSAIRNAL